ncbi:hypothetical protein AB6A40_009529 [Gnathostoma spinigerum]|uniref:A to I editase domain-containing protein n=1 Tax=Gnathostoma spinigerum TaxID=75299 RepID=A0ABD6ES87_9BILA
MFSFVIVSPSGEKSMVSLGAGRNAVVNGHLLVYSPGSVLIHMQAVVLARRGFILFLHRQFENLDSADCIIERSTGSSTYRIKSGYKVVLFTAFAPTPVRMEPLPQKLSCFSSGYSRPVEVPESSQTYEDLLSGKVNVMSVSDKILKWNYLGLQGALMSTIMEPVYISNICVIQHVNEQAVTRAVLLRFGESRKSQLQITSLQEQISPHGEIYHDWVRGIGTVERLDPLTGRTITGSPSRLCKSEMFESWSRMMSHLKNVNSKTYSTCAEAKTNAKVYMNALDSFIEQLDTLELGKWQRKDRRIDDFKLISFDQ